LSDGTPTFNQAAFDAFGFDNSATIDGNDLIQPRFGFNYTFDSDRPMQLRGGIGLFQGASANVWLSNPFTNTGFGYIDYNLSSGFPDTAACMQTGQRCFSADPAAQIDLIPEGARTGTQSIDFIDPDLGQPSVWKANLAFDHELPWWGVVGAAELVLTSVKEAQAALHSATTKRVPMHPPPRSPPRDTPPGASPAPLPSTPASRRPPRSQAPHHHPAN
jgi:hypothetical protein